MHQSTFTVEFLKYKYTITQTIDASNVCLKINPINLSLNVSQGDQCKFEHDNVVPEKKKELCKFYVQGYCTKGDACIYMHNIL